MTPQNKETAIILELIAVLADTVEIAENIIDWGTRQYVEDFLPEPQQETARALYRVALDRVDWTHVENELTSRLAALRK